MSAGLRFTSFLCAGVLSLGYAQELNRSGSIMSGVSDSSAGEAEPSPNELPCAQPEYDGTRYPWLTGENVEALCRRVTPVPGLSRVSAEPGSFGEWLRNLPLKPGRPSVRLFDGRPKANQEAHHAVVAIDVGHRDLQQCADAIMRLRAEYLWAAGCANSIMFRFTSGDPATWRAWKAGFRPSVHGSSVMWARTAPADDTYSSFRSYLETVFTYAGSASLEGELEPVADPSKLEIGDVFVQGGYPGHAVIVVDVAEGRRGGRWFLLAQSFMPAQEIHILENPHDLSSPWYQARASGQLRTPEWTFNHEDLRRFPAVGCP